MSNQEIAKTEKDTKTLGYTPIGGVDEIKLSVEIVKKYFCAPTRSGQICSDRDATRFVLLCQGQRLSPAQNDCYLVGYDSDKGPTFSMIVSHAALLKRAETVPDYEGMESGIIFRADKEGPINEREGDFSVSPEIVLGGWAKVYRKGRKPIYRRLSIAAMMPTYPSPFWKGEKAFAQIVKCAEADALRSAFPALNGGLFIEGEVNNRSLDITSELVPEKRAEPTGHTKALNPAPAAKTERPRPTAPTETSKPIETGKTETKPEPGPEPEAMTGLEPEAETEPAALLDGEGSEFKARNGETEALTTVRRLLLNHGKTEEALLTCGIRKKFVKEGQKLADLSEKKLIAIALDQTWKSLLSEVEFK